MDIVLTEEAIWYLISVFEEYGFGEFWNNLLSLIPLKQTVKKVKTENLKYPLNHEDLFFGYSRGISNVFTQSTAAVSIESGMLLIIHERVELA